MPESLLELTIDQPVAGGRMLARHEGKVVLVAGGIPGERVRVRIERTSRDVTWAAVTDVVSASTDRREPPCNPACGGLTYAHVQYPRQLQLKADVVADAFRRIAKVTLEKPVRVEPSPERSYRLRARLHVRDRRAGLFLEGTHTLCDAAATGQLLPGAIVSVDAALKAIESRLAECEAVVVAENIAGTERVVHFEPRDGARLDDLARRIELPAGATGLSTATGGRTTTLAGAAAVTDTAAQLFAGYSPVGNLAAWTRRAASFFQGNRYLTGALVRRVLELTPGGTIADLYAGVGLFAIALAARGSQVHAVEGDRSAGDDLESNAGPWREALHITHTAVEDAVASPARVPFDAVVVDPPRTGLSPEALRGLLGWRPPRVTYVSCDSPTLARDTAHLLEAGYELQSVDAFDLFPNTPHVETVAVFKRP